MSGMSRNKGKRGEREAAAFLRSIGFDSAVRGVQHRGGPDSPDVLCVEELPNVHLEIKRNEKIALGTKLHEAAVEQASVEAGDGKDWALLWRRNRSPWLLTFPAGAPMICATVCGDDIRHALLWLQSETAAVARYDTGAKRELSA